MDPPTASSKVQIDFPNAPVASPKPGNTRQSLISVSGLSPDVLQDPQGFLSFLENVPVSPDNHTVEGDDLVLHFNDPDEAKNLLENGPTKYKAKLLKFTPKPNNTERVVFSDLPDRLLQGNELKKLCEEYLGSFPADYQVDLSTKQITVTLEKATFLTSEKILSLGKPLVCSKVENSIKIHIYFLGLTPVSLDKFNQFFLDAHDFPLKDCQQVSQSPPMFEAFILPTQFELISCSKYQGQPLLFVSAGDQILFHCPLLANPDTAITPEQLSDGVAKETGIRPQSCHLLGNNKFAAFYFRPEEPKDKLLNRKLIVNLTVADPSTDSSPPSHPSKQVYQQDASNPSLSINIPNVPSVLIQRNPYVSKGNISKYLKSKLNSDIGVITNDKENNFIVPLPEDKIVSALAMVKVHVPAYNGASRWTVILAISPLFPVPEGYLEFPKIQYLYLFLRKELENIKDQFNVELNGLDQRLGVFLQINGEQSRVARARDQIQKLIGGFNTLRFEISPSSHPKTQELLTIKYKEIEQRTKTIIFASGKEAIIGSLDNEQLHSVKEELQNLDPKVDPILLTEDEHQFLNKEKQKIIEALHKHTNVAYEFVDNKLFLYSINKNDHEAFKENFTEITQEGCYHRNLPTAAVFLHYLRQNKSVLSTYIQNQDVKVVLEKGCICITGEKKLADKCADDINELIRSKSPIRTIDVQTNLLSFGDLQQSLVKQIKQICGSKAFYHLDYDKLPQQAQVVLAQGTPVIFSQEPQQNKSKKQRKPKKQAVLKCTITLLNISYTDADWPQVIQAIQNLTYQSKDVPFKPSSDQESTQLKTWCSSYNLLFDIPKNQIIGFGRTGEFEKLLGQVYSQHQTKFVITHAEARPAVWIYLYKKKKDEIEQTNGDEDIEVEFERQSIGVLSPMASNKSPQKAYQKPKEQPKYEYSVSISGSFPLCEKKASTIKDIIKSVQCQSKNIPLGMNRFPLLHHRFEPKFHDKFPSSHFEIRKIPDKHISIQFSSSNPLELQAIADEIDQYNAPPMSQSFQIPSQGVQTLKEMINDGFQREYGVDCRIFKIGPVKADIKICGLNQQEITAAQGAILQNLSSFAQVTKEISLNEYHGLLKHILKKEKKYLSSLPQVKTTLIDNKLSIRGRSEDVDAQIQKFKNLFNGELKIQSLVYSLPKFGTYVLTQKRKAEIEKVHNVRIEGSQGLCYFVQPESSTVVWIYNGDMFEHPADAIVNPANTALSNQGGVAGLLANKAGPQWDEECQSILTKYGYLVPGEAYRTSAGNLRDYKSIINVVGPQGQDWNKRQTLEKCIINILNCVRDRGYQSVLIPTISAGNSRPDLAKSHSIELGGWYDPLLLAVLNELANPKITLKIILCDISPQVARLLQQAAQQHFVSNQSFTSTNPDWLTHINNATVAAERQYIVKHQWSWQDDQGSFNDYDLDQNLQLDIAFQEGYSKRDVVGDLLKVKNGWQYEIDFTKMIQTNKTTKRERVIRRREVEYPAQPIANKGQSKVAPKVESKVESSKIESADSITIYGREGDANKALNSIKTLMQTHITSSTEPLSRKLPFRMSKALAGRLSKIGGIEFQILDATITLSGASKSISQANNEISLFFRVDMIGFVDYPDAWEDQDTNLKLVELDSQEQEYQQIKARFEETCPGKTIISIQRVQNKLLWEKYFNQKKFIDAKNPGMTTEKLLFHGTNQTPPQTLYNGEDGFDYKFCNSGMWGKGTYFATNARYSDAGYAYQSPEGKQLFFAQVLTGNSKELSTDRSLTMPPVKGANDAGVMERYDSVAAPTPTSLNYVVYDIGRAYPSFLITYK